MTKITSAFTRAHHSYRYSVLATLGVALVSFVGGYGFTRWQLEAGQPLAADARSRPTAIVPYVSSTSQQAQQQSWQLVSSLYREVVSDRFEAAVVRSPTQLSAKQDSFVTVKFEPLEGTAEIAIR